MLVYGDPSYEASLASLVDSLRSRAENLSPEASLDELRTLLIEAGQLEQAVGDASPGPEAIGASEAITDIAARAYLRRWNGLEPVELADLDKMLDALPRGDGPLIVKLPEGFAFYGLYPEGYIVAAQKWLESACPEGPVAVVGIRTIGTSLSALVAATLSATVPARRITVRPWGHPFQRQVEIDPAVLDGAAWILVVDEGPGQSGSSMASVAEAVHRAGIPRERIAFLPGHGGQPGAQASEETRAWWDSTPRFFTPTEALCWNGRTLEATLANATGDVQSVEELSGGFWRECVFATPEEWPSVALPFERRKILVTRRDGSAVLWKFAGLSVPGTTLGFESQQWIEGEPVRRADATPELLAQIWRHIATVAGPPLSRGESARAKERLVEMVRVNLQEAGLSPQPPLQDEPLEEGEPSAGDYRLAPWDWRRLPSGQIVKAGKVAPTLDHTLVGRQPVAWDVAGAMVEWGLDDAAAAPLLAEAPKIEPQRLRFYRLAYAAFRMGMCAMCAGISDESEEKRLRRDEAFYRAEILRLL